MGSLFGSTPRLQLPPVTPPPPLPQTGDQESLLRMMRRRRGRQDTILAGDLVPTDVGKKTLLG